MSEWTENFKKAHAEYVRKDKTVKAVMEHRFVGEGEIYCVSLAKGGFEVREHAKTGGAVTKRYPFAKGTEAIKAYRALRDKMVPGFKSPEKAKPAPVAKTTKTKTTKKATSKKEPTGDQLPARKK